MSKDIKKRLTAIEERNRHVELDKQREGSWLRRLSIMTLTNLVVIAYLHFVVRIDPWINALVPVIGFFLYTLTISLLKKAWVRTKK